MHKRKLKNYLLLYGPRDNAAEPEEEGSAYNAKVLATNPAQFIDFNVPEGVLEGAVAIDLSGNGYHGSYENVSDLITTGHTGIGDIGGGSFLQAVNWNGDGYIELFANNEALWASIDENNCTYLMWFAYITEVSKPDDEGDMFFAQTDQVGQNFRLYNDYDSGWQSIRDTDTDISGVEKGGQVADGVYPDFSSILVRFDQDGDGHRIWYDGVSEASDATIAAWGNGNINGAGITGRAGNPGGSVSWGYVAKWAIWTSALSDATIESLGVIL